MIAISQGREKDLWLALGFLVAIFLISELDKKLQNK